MAQLTPQFLFDLESNMRIISESHYHRLASNVWWPKVATYMESKSRKERLIWLLETAKIERPDASHGGGEQIFEDILSQTVEYENENAVAGLELKKEEIDDIDGQGIKLAAHWAKQMGAYAGYWPQKVIADAIKSNPTTYDGELFFSGAHPVNPFADNPATFSNNFTGAEDGAFPGAVPVDASVTPEVALENLAKAIAYTASIPMPNGEDPRFLKPMGILHPPALTKRMQTLTNAKFIATASGGSEDVEAVISNMGLGQPIVAPELGAAFGGSDTDYYLLMEDITGNELGAFAYIDREPFSMVMHGMLTDAELARTRELQWTTEGRNTVGAGHPYLMFRCRSV